ncbi:MAG TPA: carboxypeptidase-like regulatory domain-containing protein, partial [Terriglobales bacterium]|nr:carboxypeptidase-like regulatory domain-containing protein [Terriglobales bacterium]
MATAHVRLGKALLAAVISLSLGTAARLAAQVVGATVSGVVTDPSGKAVAGATVTLLNTTQGNARTTKTNADGLYVAPNLVPGPYRMEVSAPGFSSEVREGITLTIGDRPVINVALAVGSVVTSVEVQSQTDVLESSSAALSGLVDGTTTRELPLNGRDYTQLAILQPGVGLIRSQPDANSVSSRGNRGFGTQFTIAGGRPPQNSYRVDG